MSDQDFLIRVKADIEKAVADLHTLTTELANTDKGADKASAGVGKLNKTIDDMKRLVGGYFSFRYATKILLEADAFNVLQQRIKTATKETGDYAAVSAQLFDITVRNGTALEGTVSLFQNIARAAPELGATNKEILSVVDAVQQLGIISGASRDNLNAGLLQLSQALAKGRLDGDELKSLMENFPELINRIAKGLGISVGQMRQLGEEGKLVSSDIFATMLKQAPEIASEFGEIPSSVARSAASLSTVFSELLSTFDKATGVTSFIAQSLQGLATLLKKSDGPDLGLMQKQLDYLLERRADIASLADGSVTATEALSALLSGIGIAGIKNAPYEIKKLDADIAELEKKILAAWDASDKSPIVSDKAITNLSKASDETEKTQKKISEMLDGLQQQAELFGKSSDEVALYKLALLGANDAQIANAKTSLDMLNAKQKTKEAAEAEAKALEDLADAIAGTDAASQNYLDAAAKLHDELSSGVLTYDEYTKAMDKLDKGDQFKGLADKGDEAMQRLESATRGWGEQFTNTLADMVQSGKLSFSELADSIISDLLRIMIYQNITAPIFGGLGIPGFSAPTNHTGGIAGQSGGSKFVDPSIFIGAPRFHNGRIPGLASNEIPAILEDDEEVLTSDDPRHIRNAGKGGAVKVEIIKNGTPIEADSASAQFDAEGMVVRVLLNDYQRGGPMSQRIKRG